MLNASNSTVLVDHCLPAYVWQYLEVGMLSLMFLLGAPVNLHVYQLQRDPTFPTLYHVPPSFRELQKQLNIADLMVLFIYVPSMICELLTKPYWRAGNIMCKLVKFSSLLSVTMSSNMVAAIAIDRVIKPEARFNKVLSRIVQAVAWISAVAVSAPTLWIWYVKVDPSNPHIAKCVTIEHDFKNIYNWSHLIFSFMLPAFVVACCYMHLLCRLCPPCMLTTGHLAVSARAEDRVTEVSELEAGDYDALQTAAAANSCKHRFSMVSKLSSKIRPFPRMGNALWISFLLTTAFIVFWLPYVIASYIRPVTNRLCYPAMLEQLIVMNSVVNPFLYALTTDMKRLKSWIRRLPTSRFLA